MELINNVSKTLKDDLSVEIKNGSKLSIAAACFSIYAFQELKNELTNTFSSSCSHTCAKLKDRNNLIEYLKDFNIETDKNDSSDEDTGDTAFLIAKIEYPYIIALH